jgi:hypothetical protein
MKGVFIRLKDRISGKEHVLFTFILRPGVSYSLRAAKDNLNERARPLFVMIDIIDDDSKNRWLSVCFYNDMVEDPGEKGEFIPGGLLGEDGRCFDLYEQDEDLILYIEQRIDEAHANMATLNGCPDY